MIVISVIVFIVILSVLVVIHELGHFGLAKWFGVAVDEFGIGFPPRLLGKKFGKTLYSINWIPLGGFVKIKGVVGGDQMDTVVMDGSDSFNSHPLWQRFLILFGGIMMNFILTVVIFAVGYSIGFPTGTNNLPSNATVRDVAVVIVNVVPGTPAAEAGLQVEDKIQQVNHQPVTTAAALQNILQTVNTDSPAVITVERNQTTMELTVSVMTLGASGRKGLGVEIVDTGIVKLPLLTAIRYGFYQTVDLAKQIILAFTAVIGSVFTRTATVGEVSGPLGIASLTHQATQMGFIYILQLAALLSINLAIFNLLPLPALDGGRILFVVIEMIFRRPVNQKIEAVIHNIGFILLLLMIMAVTVKDLIKLF